MNWGTCKQGSNNIHFNFPPIMNDSRNFSSYVPGSSRDMILKKNNNITTNQEYREFLIKNADKIISENQKLVCDECSSCYYNNTNNIEKPKQPYIFTTILSNDVPYGYETSDLKEIYLTRQRLNAEKHAPVINLQK